MTSWGGISIYNWRAREASETLLVVVQWETRYVYTYIYIYRYVRHTFVARSWGDVMWEELSASHFENIVTIGNGH